MKHMMRQVNDDPKKYKLITKINYSKGFYEIEITYKHLPFICIYFCSLNLMLSLGNYLNLV